LATASFSTGIGAEAHATMVSAMPHQNALRKPAVVIIVTPYPPK
jgi:hypothetical protein